VGELPNACAEAEIHLFCQMIQILPITIL